MKDKIIPFPITLQKLLNVQCLKQPHVEHYHRMLSDIFSKLINIFGKENIKCCLENVKHSKGLHSYGFISKDGSLLISLRKDSEDKYPIISFSIYDIRSLHLIIPIFDAISPSFLLEEIMLEVKNIKNPSYEGMSLISKASFDGTFNKKILDFFEECLDSKSEDISRAIPYAVLDHCMYYSNLIPIFEDKFKQIDEDDALYLDIEYSLDYMRDAMIDDAETFGYIEFINDIRLLYNR